MRVEAGRHYRVVRFDRWSGANVGGIMGLACMLCPGKPLLFSRIDSQQGTDRSGLGRYNRMRAGTTYTNRHKAKMTIQTCLAGRHSSARKSHRTRPKTSSKAT